MKKLIIATTTALGLAGAGGASLAQDQSQTTRLQDVVVTGVRAPYETYVTGLPAGFQLQALVGQTHVRYMQAQRAAAKAESQRRQGLTLQPQVSVAIDNSSGAGVARQIQLSNAAHEVVAIVNVYCKRAVPSGSAHCRLDPRPVRASGSDQRLASTRAIDLQLAEVDPHR